MSTIGRKRFRDYASVDDEERNEKRVQKRSNAGRKGRYSAKNKSAWPDLLQSLDSQLLENKISYLNKPHEIEAIKAKVPDPKFFAFVPSPNNPTEEPHEKEIRDMKNDVVKKLYTDALSRQISKRNSCSGTTKSASQSSWTSSTRQSTTNSTTTRNVRALPWTQNSNSSPSYSICSWPMVFTRASMYDPWQHSSRNYRRPPSDGPSSCYPSTITSPPWLRWSKQHHWPVRYYAAPSPCQSPSPTRHSPATQLSTAPYTKQRFLNNCCCHEGRAGQGRSRLAAWRTGTEPQASRPDPEENPPRPCPRLSQHRDLEDLCGVTHWSSLTVPGPPCTQGTLVGTFLIPCVV